MRVALLGTGLMGAGMTRSLLRAGHEVAVWNRSPEKAEPLAADGARVHADVAGVVRGAEVVLTVLYDADSVLGVLAEAEPGLTAGAVWAQCSTIGVAGTARAAEQAARLGLVLLDAPVLGTRRPAEEGRLVVLASGPTGAREVVAPVLDAIGARTLWVSERVGDASALKLVCNSWVATLTAAAGQAVALARGLGLDPQLFLEAIRGGPVDSPYAHAKGGLMIAREFPTSFAVDGVVKDVGLIRAAAEQAGVSGSLLEAVQASFQQASDRGHGADDMAAVVAAFPVKPG